jgi:hypothetical protein
MWVSQTYLGNIGGGADVYIYYFWEDYASRWLMTPYCKIWQSLATPSEIG